MTYALAPLPAAAPAWLVVDAVRCWREARDHGRAVLPTLFARLELRRAGFLAPAIDALLAMLEAWSGRRFRAGSPAAAKLTDDEHQLLSLLDRSPAPSPLHAARPGLTAPLQIAVRSTHLIIRSVLGQNIAMPAIIGPTPIFFSAAADGEAGSARSSVGLREPCGAGYAATCS